MPNLNRVMLMGNLTRDPELRHTNKGTAVTDIGLAINRFFAGDDGHRREETTFVDITLWGRQAEVVCQYCQKGRPLYVEGRLQLDSWQDQSTGQQRSRLKVVGETIQLLGSRDGNGGGGGGNYQQGGSGGSYQSGPPQQQGGYQSQPAAYQPPPQQQYSPPPNQAPGSPPPPTDDEEDDIPF